MKRACPTCGRIIDATETHCADHQQPDRGTTSARGYDGDHKRRRAELLPLAIGKPCPLCEEPMLEHQALALDHTTPLAVDATSRGDRIVHASCNIARGNQARGAGRPIFADPHRPGMGFPREKVRDEVVIG